MKVQLLSDLHLEYSHKTLPKISAEADVLVYAGDIAASKNNLYQYFNSIRKTHKIPIVMILGNHDYYNSYLNKAADKLKSAVEKLDDIHILNRESIEIGDVTFVGTTLWTDFDRGRDEVAVMQVFPDYKKIYKVSSDYRKVKINTNDILKEHRKDVKWLRETIQPDKKTVIVTHHVPTNSFIPECYKSSVLNGGFYVDMSDFMIDYEVDVWCCGHTHFFMDCEINDCRIFCNPWGYPFEDNSDGHYKEEFIFEV